MKVTFNNTQIDVAEGITLGQLLRTRNIATIGVAVAVNNKVIRKAQWHDVILTSGDDIMVITAVCGG